LMIADQYVARLHNVRLLPSGVNQKYRRSML
jgi:hypothetical protein